MKVLVTGANGFIGRQCLPKLLQRGFHVCAISSQDRRSGDVEWRRANLLNAEEMRVAVASLRPTHLLHLAWITTPGVYWTSPENLQWLAASLQLIEEFRSRNGMRAVVAGTCAEYDWTEGVCSETTTALRPATLYGTCKHALQQVLASYPIRINGEQVVVRPLDLRRTYARLLYDAGADFFSIQRYLGVKQANTVAAYLAGERQPTWETLAEIFDLHELENRSLYR